MTFETILFDVRDGVAHITLNREANANAMNLQMAKDLMYAALECDETAEIRAVHIGAKGKMFCAGGDLASFTEAESGMPSLLKEITTYLHAAVSRFSRGAAPVVASVGGTAAGAGFSLVCAADIAIASEKAKFTMAYTGVGLTQPRAERRRSPRLGDPQPGRRAGRTCRHQRRARGQAGDGGHRRLRPHQAALAFERQRVA